MFVVKKNKNKTESIPSEEIDCGQLKALTSGLAYKIARELAKGPKYAYSLSKKFGVHEQKIYYHINNLKKKGLVKLVEKKHKKKSSANFYKLKSPSFTLRFGEFKPTKKLNFLREKHRNFLNPFIRKGELNALFIVGSPDPHGPERARARDGYYGIDFALFLGTFLNYVPKLNVKLDTEVRKEELENNNLIIIGGLVTNKIMEKVNSSLPINFNKANNIFSHISEQEYSSEDNGMIVKSKNPFNEQKSVLVLAGKRYRGTRAAIIAFLQDFSSVCDGNIYKRKFNARVVEGYDINSDNVVDYIEFNE